jgi:hypothetical protein
MNSTANNSRQEIAQALEPMKAAMAAAILAWMQAQVEQHDAELAAAAAELEAAVRATPAQCSPWQVPAWMLGPLYARTAQDAIDQGGKHLGNYTLAARRVGRTFHSRSHRYAVEAIAEARSLAAARDRLASMAEAQAAAAVLGMVNKLAGKLEAAGSIARHACYGVNPNSFTLDVHTGTGRFLRVSTHRVTNYRNGRPYWQWPSRIAEHLPGGCWRPVPASKLAQAPAVP